ncbi:MAG: TIGR02647 family protein [Gammaproteobacteria bacterium]|nr:TIGR02647 family protein [Gammaproteobacteria bacterium]MCP4430244.1 TIGR02647 family protein [Gammaproteobacteria bacterium]
MKFTLENFEELHVLMLYHSSTGLDGIKIHRSADPGVIAAAQRLFDDGFITRSDGGYLTSRGSEAAEHAHLLLSLLNAGGCQEFH